jgi:hypothetical protein
MDATARVDHGSSEDEATGLMRAGGLVLSEDEERRLAALYQRFAPARAALAAVELGELEPLVIVAPPGELQERR